MTSLKANVNDNHDAVMLRHSLGGAYNAQTLKAMNEYPRGIVWDEDAIKDASREDYFALHMRNLGRNIQTFGELCIRPAHKLYVAQVFIHHFHRHSRPPPSWKFGLELWDRYGIIGVATVGRPVSRHMDDGYTLELTRVALMDRLPKNSASMLIGRCARVAKDQGYTRLISYTLDHEHGTSYKASGFQDEGIQTSNGKWSRRKNPYPDVKESSNRDHWDELEAEALEMHNEEPIRRWSITF